MTRKKLQSSFIIILFCIVSVQRIKCAEYEITSLYFQDFDEESPSFDSPYITETLAYENKSAKIDVDENELPDQCIFIYPNVTIDERVDISFYWRFNIESNYSIGILFKIKQNSEEIAIGMMLAHNETLFKPNGVHYFDEEDIGHRIAKDEWVHFQIDDLGSKLSEYSGIDSENIKIIQMTFFCFHISQNGYVMVDNLSFNNYQLRNIENTGGFDTFSDYMTILLIIMGIILSLVLIQNKRKK